MFFNFKGSPKSMKGQIDEVSELKYSYRKSVHVNIQQVDRNSKRKYPNKILNFTFQISPKASTIFQGGDRPLAIAIKPTSPECLLCYQNP